MEKIERRRCGTDPEKVSYTMLIQGILSKMRSAHWATLPLTWAGQFRSLDPFDCREPRRCAVVVESRLNPVWFNGGDIPSITWIQRRSQLFLSDGVRTTLGTIVTETQHI
jgi:hypothetical protein